MGNKEYSLCQNSNNFCQIFPMEKNIIRKSISLPRRKFDIKNSSSYSSMMNNHFPDFSQIENGGKIDITNTNNSNMKSFQSQNNKSKKFFLLNPKLKNNTLKLNNTSKTVLKNIENKKKSISYDKNNNMNLINKKKIFFITDMKHNIKFRKNNNNKIEDINEIMGNLDKDKEENNEMKKKENITTEEEEDTIINNSITENSNNSNNSINSKDKKSSQKKEKSIDNEKKSYNNLEEKKLGNEIDNISDIKKIKESNEFSENNENIYSEKEIELSIPNKKTNDKHKNSSTKGLKINNFRSSINSKSKSGFASRNVFFNNSNYTNEKEVKITNENYDLFTTKHPLNFLIKERKIKTSIYPLNNNSFNILTYEEDNSKQYSLIKDGMPNGITKFVIDEENNIIFKGEYENGYPKGYGLYSTGKKGSCYEGIWDKQLLLGIETWKDGSIYMGEFKNNKKEGLGLYRWQDGTLYYGEWKNDNMEGFCNIKFIDDRAYEGQMKNGLKNGYGEFTWKPIRKYIGYYINDLKDGFGIYIWNIKAFKIFAGFWHKGKIEGLGMVINGKDAHYGIWSYGEKVESFKNLGEFELKFKSTEYNIGKTLIRRRSTILEDNTNVNDSNNQNFDKKEKKKKYVYQAKSELQGFINFMCQDINVIKHFINNAYYKYNELKS